MVPILASAFPYTGNGLGGLSDAVEAVVTHEINGIYELFMRYPVSGLHYEDLANGKIVMAKPDDITDEQPFRIYRITKPLNGIVSVYARHICYDLSGIVVEPFTAGSLTEAFQTIPTKCTPSSPITLSTTRAVASGITLSEPRPLWKLLGGQEGSLLDVYGGEWDFDKLTAKLVTQLGTDRGVNIRYGKNLTEMEQDTTIEASYSGVYPYWYDEETDTLVTLTEKVVAVTGSVVTDRNLVLNCSDDFDTQPTEQQLRDRANAYISANSIGNVAASWKISFVDTTEGVDRVMLGDTLHVFYAALGVNATARAVKTEYDVLQERYKAITVGKVKQNLAAIIVNDQKETASKIKTTKSFLEQAIEDATYSITHGGGTFREIYDGYTLKEIVSLDDPDITLAQSVWRWNNGGFGHSSTGYNGQYTLALLPDGSINAAMITTGILNSNIIRAGILQDVLGKNSWNLDTGAFTITNGSINISTNSAVYDLIQLNWNDNNANNITTRMWAGGVTSRDNTSRITAEHTRWGFSVMKSTIDGSQSFPVASLGSGTLQLGGNSSTFPNEGSGVSGTLFVKNSMGETVATIQPSGNYENFQNGITRSILASGFLYQYDSNGTQRQTLSSDGKLWQYDSSGKKRTYLEYGDIFLYTSAEKKTAHLSGSNFVSGGSLQLHDTSEIERARLTTDGLSFYNASGTTTLTAGTYNGTSGILYLYDGSTPSYRAYLDYTALSFRDTSGTTQSQIRQTEFTLYSSGVKRNTMIPTGNMQYDSSGVKISQWDNASLKYYNTSGAVQAKFGILASSAWYSGRANAALVSSKQPSSTGDYYPLASVKAYSSDWTIGTLNDDLYFVNTPDANYSSSVNNMLRYKLQYVSTTGGNKSGDILTTLNTTDRVTEQGTSGIWRYRKWASGYAECWGTIAAAEHTFSAWGTGYYSTEVGVQTYPVTFSGAPYELATPLSGNAWVSLLSSDTKQTATKSGGYRAFRPVSGNATFGIEIYACGQLA